MAKPKPLPLIPNDDFTYNEARSTRGKIACFDVVSSTEENTTYRTSHMLGTDTYWCSCMGFTAHKRCKHAHSLRYYYRVAEERRRLAGVSDLELVKRDEDIRAVIADMGSVDWPAQAEHDAIGDEIAARMGAPLAPFDPREEAA
jgi:hypothetical protein